MRKFSKLPLRDDIVIRDNPVKPVDNSSVTPFWQNKVVSFEKTTDSVDAESLGLDADEVEDYIIDLLAELRDLALKSGLFSLAHRFDQVLNEHLREKKT